MARERLAARAERAGGRVVVRLDFALPAARRLYLVVRGPFPSCRAVGAIPVRGRAGENTVRFAGRIGSRRLDPGVYVLTLAPSRTAPAGPSSEVVRVVSPRRTVPLPETAAIPACEPSSRTLDRVAQFLRSEASSAPPPSATPSATPAAVVLEPPQRPAVPLRPPEVPPEGLLPRDLLPVLTGDGPSGPLELALTFVVFALVGGLLVVLFALLARAFARARGL